MLGGVTSALGVDLGSLGNLAKLVDVFKALDIDPALISKFTPIVTSWLTDKGGSGIGEILKKFV